VEMRQRLQEQDGLFRTSSWICRIAPCPAHHLVSIPRAERIGEGGLLNMGHYILVLWKKVTHRGGIRGPLSMPPRQLSLMPGPVRDSVIRQGKGSKGAACTFGDCNLWGRHSSGPCRLSRRAAGRSRVTSRVIGRC
jgi:hypothetical protein